MFSTVDNYRARLYHRKCFSLLIGETLRNGNSITKLTLITKIGNNPKSLSTQS